MAPDRVSNSLQLCGLADSKYPVASLAATGFFVTTHRACYINNQIKYARTHVPSFLVISNTSSTLISDLDKPNKAMAFSRSLS